MFLSAFHLSPSVAGTFNIQHSTLNTQPAQKAARPDQGQGGINRSTQSSFIFISLRLCASAFKSVPRVWRLGG
jgi:hypothetical protein